MDKRSLLFMVCLSLAFFGLQTWFSPASKPLAAAALEKNSEAPLPSLSIADLFLDPEGKTKISAALACASHYLTLSPENLPKVAYVKKGEKWEIVYRQDAAGAKRNGSEGSPIVYGSENTSPLFVPSLDLSMPIELLSLHSGYRLVSGTFKGEIFAPASPMEGPAIALLKTADRYFPVGIYDPLAQKIKALHEFDRLKEAVVQSQSVSLSPAPQGEEFYVLENEYQQLVFSTFGGSLAEINLPLHTPEDPKSIVKEIDIDRQILAQSPQNAHFPLYPHFRNIDGKTEFVEEGSLGGYYPLLRRSLISSDGAIEHAAPPEYYALHIFSEQGQLDRLNYRVTRFEPHLIQFRASAQGKVITKTFTLPAHRNGPYCFDVEIEIEGDASTLWIGSGVPDVEVVAGSYAPLLRYQVTQKGASEVETISLPKDSLVVSNTTPNWISNNNGFLGLILDPLHSTGSGYKASQVSGTVLPTRLSLIDAAYHLYPADKYPGYAVYLPLKTGETHFRVFAGPFDDDLLKSLDGLYDEPLQRYNPDYASAQSIQGWFSFISSPFAKFLFFLMNLFHTICGSWAVSIVLLTIALRAMMYPLNTWSIRSTLKMQEIGPRIKAVQERHKKDPNKARAEIVQLYKESGVNPLMGCLPMLLQMPFLFGMFYLLKSSFPLRGAVFVPGWIDDLAAPDVLFSWSQPLWFIGNEFHLLPVLMGVTMFLQSKMSASSKAPASSKEALDAQNQQKMMGRLMSVLFAVMFYKFPSGLNIYFMFSTLLGVVQQWWIMKKNRFVKGAKTHS